MPPALATALLLGLAACLCLEPVTAAAAGSQKDSVKTAAGSAQTFLDVVKNLTRGELNQLSESVAAAKNVSAWTAWEGGEVLKELPPPVPAYAHAGPCSVQPKITGVVAAPKTFNLTGEEAKDGKSVTLLTTLTLPSACTPASQRVGPWPTVAFFSGFSSPSLLYASYARHLASWGYAVLQYDLSTIVNLTPDAVELPFLPPVWAWAVGAAGEAGSALNTSGLLVAGHSRGGKLAALHLCASTAGATPGLPPIVGAALIDPVDNTLFSPESVLYPSALACVGGSAVSLTGAGVVAACNPPGSNYPSWLAAVAPGSWTARLLKASHATFVDSKVPGVNAAADAACAPPGGLPHAVAADAAAAQMTAWFDFTVTPFTDPAVPALQVAYVAWATDQGAWMEWAVKA